MDFVRKTDPQLQLILLDRRQVTDADNFELLFVTFGDAFDHVADQCAGQPVNGFRLTRFLLAGDNDLLCAASSNCTSTSGKNDCFNLPKGPFDRNFAGRDGDLTLSGTATGIFPIRDMVFEAASD